MATNRPYASIALMAVGVLAMGPLSDLVDSNGLALGFAVGGGLTLLVGGLWWLRLLETRGAVDERFLQIGFRCSTLSFWTLLVGIMLVGNVDAADVTYPVLSHYSWLLIGGLVVFVTAWSWYSRRM